jgi:hypothetical protein
LAAPFAFSPPPEALLSDDLEALEAAFGFADFAFDLGFEADFDFGFALDFEAAFGFLLELVELAFFGFVELVEFDLELAFAPFPLERLCALLPLDLVLPPLLVFVVAIVVLSSR